MPGGASRGHWGGGGGQTPTHCSASPRGKKKIPHNLEFFKPKVQKTQGVGAGGDLLSIPSPRCWHFGGDHPPACPWGASLASAPCKKGGERQMHGDLPKSGTPYFKVIVGGGWHWGRACVALGRGIGPIPDGTSPPLTWVGAHAGLLQSITWGGPQPGVFNPWEEFGGGGGRTHRMVMGAGGWVLTSCSPPQPCSGAAWLTPRAALASTHWSLGTPTVATAT